ncbi:ligand-binding sensor domain-containing protein [Paraflavitalea speifideaquila]|uniref:ligand-binding sensor domain-containing protein n=1 Tax=Paraflavitalea speifideaquila TaxID=3076558 RepID=UPI0028E1FD05|nr:two-component regulator propeller domain-containing protein [Paraflavitalea speifideiaquila]
MPFPIQIPNPRVRIPVFCSHLAAFLSLIRHLVVWWLLLLLTVGVVNAQEYSYIHYDAKDGLAGTVVYSMCQDKEGFIWFGTETGVSRFDGTHFKNFTVKDGLPDNTIIRVFADSKGRVWLVPFKHAICYYYKGKIYNQQNDPLLKEIKLDYFVATIWENKHQEILLKGDSSVYLITSNDQVIPIASDTLKKAYIIGIGQSGNFFVLYRDHVYTYDKKHLTFYSRLKAGLGGPGHAILDDQLLCSLESYGKVRIRSSLHKLDYVYDAPPLSNMYRLNDSILCLNTTRGAIFLNILQRKAENHFLPGKNISNMLTDREGGVWFSTFNDGVYRLSSKEFKNIKKKLMTGKS